MKTDKEFNTPSHYVIANILPTKQLVDMILNSEEVKKLNISNSQIFNLGNVLKYRLRAGKKDIASIESDINKALDFEERMKSV